MFNRTLMDLKASTFENQRFHVAVLGRNPMIVLEPRQFRPPEQRATRSWLDPQGRFHDWLFVDLQKEFWNIGIQMVLRVTEVHLTPDNPRYEGEDWHVEGQMVSLYQSTNSFMDPLWYLLDAECSLYPK